MTDLIRAPQRGDEAALLRLNNTHAVELSELDAAGLRRLIDAAWRVRVAGACNALLIAFDQSAPYDNPNFAWFAARHPRFVYVDRVVVAPEARGRGLARALYEDLIAAARAAGHGLIGCEVNLDPPNLASDRFHERLAFAEAGRAELTASGKTVRYLTRAI